MKYNIKDENMFGINMRASKEASEKLAREAEMANMLHKLNQLDEFSEIKFIDDLYIKGGIKLVGEYIQFVETGKYSYEVLEKMKKWYNHFRYDPSDPYELY